MADLVVLGFSTKEIAEDVWELGTTMAEEGLVDLDDSALVWREKNGRVRIQRSLPRRRSVRPVGRRVEPSGGSCWDCCSRIRWSVSGSAPWRAERPARRPARSWTSGSTRISSVVSANNYNPEPRLCSVWPAGRRRTESPRCSSASILWVLHTNLSRDREADLVKALQVAI